MSETNELIEMLPSYYRLSKQMKTIMDISAIKIPNISDELWRVFFLSLTQEEWLGLWKKEFDAKTREEIAVKKQSTGMINKESLELNNLDAIDQFVYSPESGFILSGENSVFADGRYYGPMIAKIVSDPDNIYKAKELLRYKGLSGFKYLFQILMEESIKIEVPKQSAYRAMTQGAIFPVAIGLKSDSSAGCAVYHNYTENTNFDGWSDALTFSDNYFFTEDVPTNSEIELIQRRRTN